jgi:hypothetical protein
LTAEPVAVRFVEGVTRGLLTVQALDGTLLGQGDLTQTVRGGRVESRMVLRLHDGSLFDEEVTFTQDRVFSLVRYKVTQRGPAFPESLVASLDAKTGEYEVRARKGDEDSEYSGRLDLPPDVGTGMFIMLVRNLGDRLSASVHTVAWTPKPRIVQVDIVRAGSDQARVAQQTRPARRYELRPKLGLLLSLGAKLMGRRVDPTVCWILDDPVPAFVACEGALGSAQTPWRIGTVSATKRESSAGR